MRLQLYTSRRATSSAPKRPHLVSMESGSIDCNTGLEAYVDVRNTTMVSPTMHTSARPEHSAVMQAEDANPSPECQAAHRNRTRQTPSGAPDVMFGESASLERAVAFMEKMKVHASCAVKVGDGIRPSHLLHPTT